MGHYGDKDRDVGGCQCFDCSPPPEAPETMGWDDLPRTTKDTVASLAAESDLMLGFWEDIGGAVFVHVDGRLTVVPGPTYHHRDGEPAEKAVAELLGVTETRDEAMAIAINDRFERDGDRVHAESLGGRTPDGSMVIAGPAVAARREPRGRVDAVAGRLADAGGVGA